MTRHHLTDRLADMVAVDLVAAVVEEEAVDGTLATSINLQVQILTKNNYTLYYCIALAPYGATRLTYSFILF